MKNYDRIKLFLSATLKQFKVTIYHKELEPLVDLNTNLFSFTMTQRLGDSEIAIKLNSLEVNEYLFKYKNPSLDKFITSATLDAFQNNLSESMPGNLFELTIKMMDKDHPRYVDSNKTDLDLQFKFGYLYINLKPDVLESLLAFLTANLPKKSQDLPREPSPSNTQMQKDALDVEVMTGNSEKDAAKIIYSQTDNILLNINIEMKQIGIRMIHRSLKMCLGEFSLSNATMQVTLRPQETYFHGKLGNIQLLDTTNYPHVIDSNLDFEKIIPYEILGVEEKNSSLIEIDYKSYVPQNSKADLQSRVFSFLEININYISIASHLNVAAYLHMHN